MRVVRMMKSELQDLFFSLETDVTVNYNISPLWIQIVRSPESTRNRGWQCTTGAFGAMSSPQELLAHTTTTPDPGRRSRAN